MSLYMDDFIFGSLDATLLSVAEISFTAAALVGSLYECLRKQNTLRSQNWLLFCAALINVFMLGIRRSDKLHIPHRSSVSK